MKKFILAFLLLVNYAMAQGIDKEAFIKEFEELRKREMLSHQKFFGPNGPGGTNGVDFTVASNNFDIHHSRLEWSIDPAVKFINGKCTYDFVMTMASNTITFDLLNTLTVDSVLYHNSSITFQQTPQHGLILNFPATIATNTKDSVTIFYKGVPATLNPEVFYRGTQSGVPVVYTLSEPYGAREWWPCKNNLTDKTDSIDIIITTPGAYQPSSNGVLISNAIVASNRISHFKHRYPIVSYLVAIGITNYTLNDDTVRVGSNVYPWQSFFYPSANAFHRSREPFAKNAYRIFSNLFTLYPFASEKYGHTQWDWGGGMEHQTNSFILNTGPNLMAHELAHQWFGDYITCKSWQHIWLNEGFATYSTLLFLQYGYPDFYRPLLEGTHNNVVSDSTGSVFVADTTDEARIFSGRLSYNKGAYVLHMLRWTLGDSAFFKGIRRYLNDPAVKLNFALTSDLQRNMEAESGKNLTSFFQKWIYGEGYPNYHAEWSQNANNFVTVKLNQSTSHPSVSFYEMPVTLLLRGASQGQSFVVDHRFSGQEFTLNPGFVVDTVIIDPEYWILSRRKTSAKKVASTVSNEIKIFPNPSEGQLFVSLVNPTDSKLYLNMYNAIGQLVYRRDMETNGRDELIEVPMTNLARGTYMLEVRSEKNIKLVRKIVRR
jgi:aminopeptidase N